MRRSAFAVVILAAYAVVAGCGSEASGGGIGDSGGSTTRAARAAVSAGLPAVTGAPGEKPTIATPAGDPPTALATTVVAAGTGRAVAAGDLVFVDYLGVTWAGKEFDNSFDRGEPFSFTVGGGNVIKGWDQGLVGQRVGSRVLLGIPSELGYGAQGAGADIPPDTALLFAIDVLGAYQQGAAASGTAVALADAALPAVTGDGAALAVTVPAVAPPTALLARTLVEGSGPAVQAGQQIVVQYLGALWEGGTVFDSSWKRGGTPIAFGIGQGQVIAGWDEGLVGVKAGSRVLLVIPSDKAYGDAGRPPTIPAKATLVFVVDVLGSF